MGRTWRSSIVVAEWPNAAFAAEQSLQRPLPLALQLHPNVLYDPALAAFFNP